MNILADRKRAGTKKDRVFMPGVGHYDMAFGTVPCIKDYPTKKVNYIVICFEDSLTKWRMLSSILDQELGR